MYIVIVYSNAVARTIYFKNQWDTITFLISNGSASIHTVSGTDLQTHQHTHIYTHTSPIMKCNSKTTNEPQNKCK